MPQGVPIARGDLPWVPAQVDNLIVAVEIADVEDFVLREAATDALSSVLSYAI